MTGNFVTNKSGKTFSALANDQIQEHLNAMVKGESRPFRLTENDKALNHWMVADHELSMILNEYDSSFSNESATGNPHHEQIPSIQKLFQNDVVNFVKERHMCTSISEICS